MMPFAPGVMPDFAALCAAVYGGLVIGAAYDLFRLIRLPFSGRVMTWILDGLYCIAAGLIAAATMLYINCGTVRLYIFAGMAAGIYLYVRFPGRLVAEAAGRLAGRKKTVARR